MVARISGKVFGDGIGPKCRRRLKHPDVSVNGLMGNSAQAHLSGMADFHSRLDDLDTKLASLNDARFWRHAGQAGPRSDLQLCAYGAVLACNPGEALPAPFNARCCVALHGHGTRAPPPLSSSPFRCSNRRGACDWPRHRHSRCRVAGGQSIHINHLYYICHHAEPPTGAACMPGDSAVGSGAAEGVCPPGPRPRQTPRRHVQWRVPRRC